MAKVPDEVEYESFYGTSGNDVIYEDAATTLTADFYGKGGNDMFIAGNNDYFIPGGGYVTDTFHGGSGTDTVSYQYSSRRIEGSLESGIINRTFGTSLSTDHVDSVEDLVGSKYDDDIYGSKAGNHLWGFDGNDVIFGYGGNDSLFGE